MNPCRKIKWMRRRRRSFWDIFDEFFEEFDREMEEAFEETRRAMERAFRTFREDELEPGKPIVYGFSMEIGPDGVPRIRHFGNVRPGKPKIVEEAEIEPYTSVIVDEERGVLRITAEMPGIEKKRIKINATEDTVVIRGENSRKYYKECKLDAPVDPDSAKATYRNGILEVTFQLKKRPGKRIKVE